MHFETARGGERGFLDFEDLDFGADARPLVLADIHLDRGGDVSGDLAEFSREIDRAMISRFLRSLVRFVAKSNDPVAMDRHMQEHYGLTVERYIDRALEISEHIRARSGGRAVARSAAGGGTTGRSTRPDSLYFQPEEKVTRETVDFSGPNPWRRVAPFFCACLRPGGTRLGRKYMACHHSRQRHPAGRP